MAILDISYIEGEWDKDSVIDASRLNAQSLEISSLHNKYNKLFRRAKKELRKLVSEKTSIYNTYYKYYSGEFNTDLGMLAKLNKQVINKKYTKEKIVSLIEAEDEYKQSAEAVEDYKDLLDYLIDIMKQINNRSYHINNSIEFLKFTKGDM